MRGEEYPADCAVVADVNGDGIDDLIVCNLRDKARMYIQTKGGTFTEINFSELRRFDDTVGSWRNVRVDYITRRATPDLVVVEDRPQQKSVLKVFQGVRNAPYFDFRQPYYKIELDDAAPDLEVVDVNSDGILDIFILQANERNGYCGARAGEQARYWNDGDDDRGDRTPSEDWVPPKSRARDVLLVGGRGSDGRGVTFTKVNMNYEVRGCPGMVERFGNGQALVLAGGRRIHAGYNYLLEWDSTTE